MPLSPQDAAAQAQQLAERQNAERAELDVLRRYWMGTQRLPAVIPSDAPTEVKEMARKARVNVISIVVDSLTQALIADGFRARDQATGDDVTVPVWRAWRANRMNKRQAGVHRAAAGYGWAYTAVIPGDPVPVIHTASPRLMTAVYAGDPDWPMFALEKRPSTGDWRLYDAEAVYRLARGDRGWTLLGEPMPHGLGYTPVIRFRDVEDLDLEDDAEPDNLRGFSTNETRLVAGQVAPLIALQDQINLTSFSLKVAEWYGAFRQRWAVGWTPAKAAEKMLAAASQFWTFDKDPAEMQLGEFGQTDLKGYLDSREAALKYAATLSQTPVHELVGALVNMSAEALAAAEAGRDRKVDERKTGFGESWEQTFQAVGALMGVEVPDDSQIIWRDTSAQAFAATVDALGKLVQMLGIPPAELLDRVPGLTAQDVRRIRAAMESGDPLLAELRMMDRQSAGAGAGAGAGG